MTPKPASPKLDHGVESCTRVPALIRDLREFFMDHGAVVANTGTIQDAYTHGLHMTEILEIKLTSL